MRAKKIFSLHIWLQRHAQVALSSLGRLTRNRFSSLMTCAVIGIALALPSGLHVLLSNFQKVSGHWNSETSISLFLRHDISNQQASALANKLRHHKQIERVDLMTRAAALEEFQKHSGFADALEALDENPLPNLLFIQPKKTFETTKMAKKLVQELRLLPQTDIVQLDLQWIRRLEAITAIAQRIVLVLAALLNIAVLLIVGNTIRLEIQNRKTEIEIHQLIGATNAFIRRPFLYTGFWYGLFGGFIAWCLITLSIILISGPVTTLARLYQSSFSLNSLPLTTTLGLLCGSSLLGLMGSWLAVSRHLKTIKPS
jgi:cell division transport system permease protein